MPREYRVVTGCNAYQLQIRMNEIAALGDQWTVLHVLQTQSSVLDRRDGVDTTVTTTVIFVNDGIAT